jgi:hypothetical protein
MTDMTFETAGHHAAGWPARAARAHDARLAARRREYYAYFALVLILELPLSLAVWTVRCLRTGTLPERGPFRAAWSQAAIIASTILSA